MSPYLEIAARDRQSRGFTMGCKYVFEANRMWSYGRSYPERAVHEDAVMSWLLERSDLNESSLAQDYKSATGFWFNGSYLLTSDDKLALEFKMRWC